MAICFISVVCNRIINGGILTAKTNGNQKYIFKLHSSRLRKNKWHLTLTLSDARRNEEIIALASSQVLRWLDELNGIVDADEQASEIKSEIQSLRRENDSIANRRAIRKLYAKLDSVQFKPDYLELTIDKEKDYHRACRGFSVNGINYKRLLGTNGGIKNSTIVFVSERHVDEIRRRIENGRNVLKELVPAKLESYKALTCSASYPVSMPRGVLVVKDIETCFTADTIYLSDEADGEPTMEERLGTEIHMDASDGFGLMLPSLAERWSDELGLGYVTCGVNTRLSWEKGMVFTFDFIEFAERVAGTYTVRDVWGAERDIRDIELILTESMLKLWDSYESLEQYLENCEENGYTFGITKVCPEHLENERSLNYQFIQSYDLNEDDIDRLLEPTITEFKEVLGLDRNKAILFLRGTELTEKNADDVAPGIIKAIMAEPALMNDGFVRNSIYQLIRNRIDEAKVGVIKVHGNYSILSGDPYALCQGIFDLPITGLLKAGEIYNKYWLDSEKLVCFRAPMSTHENIRAVVPCKRDDALYWYRYMDTCTIFNAWDTAAAAMNGADFDGDMVMVTDNDVLVRRHVSMPTLMCVQRKAKKIVPHEADLIRANIESFGNEIGRTTNFVTSMFDVQAQYSKGSDEYKILQYRIRCGQLYQQNCIDRAKGIISKPMPREWHDRHEAARIEKPDMRQLYLNVSADKKPYFMRYIYPDLMKQYNRYIKNTERSCRREYGLSVEEMAALPYSELSDNQKEFLHYYERKLPVGDHDCVMNKICKKIEHEFDHGASRISGGEFDYHILGSGAPYQKSHYNAIMKLYDDYRMIVRSYCVSAAYESQGNDEYEITSAAMLDEFKRGCSSVCPNETELCDILLDICYRRNSTKSFVWEMCSDTIMRNLLARNGGTLSFPTADNDGDILYCGKRFNEITIKTGDL